MIKDKAKNAQLSNDIIFVIGLLELPSLKIKYNTTGNK